MVTRLNIGGPAIHTILLTRGLAALGYETVLVAGRCEADDGDMSYLLGEGDPAVHVEELSRSVSPLRNAMAVYRLARVILRERPGIVHTHTAMAGTVGRLAAVLCGVPVVVHTFHGNSLQGYFSPLVSRVFLTIERLLARVTDAICVVSEQQRQELSGKWRVAGASKFRVIPLGLDLSKFLELPGAGAPEILQVGWFGRLVPIKDAGLLRGVIEATVAQTKAVRFHVAGDGPDAPLMREVAARYPGHVTFYGWQQDLTPILSGCHVLVQTSRNEGTPVALIQGMAAGRPFVSTAVGGVVDMVCGEASEVTEGARWHRNGVLVNSEPGAFASALLAFQREPGRLQAMGRAAREFAAERYSAERLIADIDSLYRELLSRKKRTPARAVSGASTRLENL